MKIDLDVGVCPMLEEELDRLGLAFLSRQADGVMPEVPAVLSHAAGGRVMTSERLLMLAMLTEMEMDEMQREMQQRPRP